MAITPPPPPPSSRQACAATDTRFFDLTAAGCGAVTMEGLAELVEQHPEVEAVFTAAGAQGRRADSQPAVLVLPTVAHVWCGARRRGHLACGAQGAEGAHAVAQVRVARATGHAVRVHITGQGPCCFSSISPWSLHLKMSSACVITPNIIVVTCVGAPKPIAATFVVTRVTRLHPEGGGRAHI